MTIPKQCWENPAPISKTKERNYLTQHDCGIDARGYLGNVIIICKKLRKKITIKMNETSKGPKYFVTEGTDKARHNDFTS